MRSNFIKRIVQFIFIIFWVMFASEIFLLCFKPQPILPRYIQTGDFGIRVNMPNLTYEHHSPDYRIKIHTNAKGIRANQGFSYDKPSSVKRIIVLGDSFGMGYGVDLEDSFTELMRSNLELRTGYKFEVINLSVSGYGTAEQLLMLQKEGIKYHPDLVLLAWHDTDIDDNIRSKLFKIESNKLIRKNKEYLPGVKTREFLFSFKIYRWMIGNSHFYNWIRHRTGKAVKDLVVYFNVQKKHTKSNNKQLATTKNAGNKQLTLLLLNQLKAEAAQIGAKLLILEIPRRVSRTKFLQSIPKKYRNQFNIINPIKKFQTYKGELLFWERSHFHFTPLGCRIVGRLLANRIIKNNLIIDVVK